MYVVYILHCSDGTYYTDRTKNLKNRLNEHKRGECIYTCKRLPVELVYSREFADEKEALAWEQQIKKWSRSKKIALIEEYKRKS